jgi:hypothetical protein
MNSRDVARAEVRVSRLEDAWARQPRAQERDEQRERLGRLEGDDI